MGEPDQSTNDVESQHQDIVYKRIPFNQFKALMKKSAIFQVCSLLKM
jgi:hypothetical protein